MTTKDPREQWLKNQIAAISQRSTASYTELESLLGAEVARLRTENADLWSRLQAAEAEAEADSLSESLAWAQGLCRHTCPSNRHEPWFTEDPKHMPCPWCAPDRLRARVLALCDEHETHGPSADIVRPHHRWVAYVPVSEIRAAVGVVNPNQPAGTSPEPTEPQCDQLIRHTLPCTEPAGHEGKHVHSTSITFGRPGDVASEPPNQPCTNDSNIATSADPNQPDEPFAVEIEIDANPSSTLQGEVLEWEITDSRGPADQNRQPE